jgi:hypothetical protein
MSKYESPAYKCSTLSLNYVCMYVCMCEVHKTFGHAIFVPHSTWPRLQWWPKRWNGLNLKHSLTPNAEITYQKREEAHLKQELLPSNSE